VDCSAFAALEAQVRGLVEAAASHHEVHAYHEEEDPLDIDHHDEFVLGKIGHLEERLDAVLGEMSGMEKSARRREAALIQRIDTLERQAKLNEDGIVVQQRTLEHLGETLQATATRLEPRLVALESNETVQVQRYDDAALRAELEKMTSALTTGLAALSTRCANASTSATDNALQIERIRDWCDGFTRIHANNIVGQAHSAMEMRDDVMTRTRRMSEILDQIVGSGEAVDLDKDEDDSSSPAAKRNAERRRKKREQTPPKSRLRQIGAIASSLRSIVIPRLAEFRTAADSIGNAISLHLAAHSLDGNSEATRNSLSELGIVAETVTASKQEVDSAISALSERVTTAWEETSALAIDLARRSDMSKLLEEMNRIKVQREKEGKKVEPPKIQIQANTIKMDDVYGVVDDALQDLRKAMREKASTVMLGVVQEQSLAQIDVLRSTLGRFDVLQRKSELLQSKIDAHARDMTYIYEHLQGVARSGGETGTVVAELKMRVSRASEDIGRLMQMKANIDSFNQNVAHRQDVILETNRQTDQRLSHMMGSFMTSVQSKLQSSKRESGEAAAAIRQRFTSELRSSILKMTKQLNEVQDQVYQMEPLLKTDTARIGITSLATRCMSCDRPIWGTEPQNKTTKIPVLVENSKEGAFQGSLLIGSPTRPSSQRSTLSPSSAFTNSPRQGNSRGGGFRVSASSFGNMGGSQGLWVGGAESPTGKFIGNPERPRTSLGLRKHFIVKR
jgi:hypothetical protein